jgi:hypothetical protein
MKVALIPSDNGLGHIRRMTLLSNFISNKIQVTILINKKNFVFNLSKKVKTEKIKNLFYLKNKTYKLLNKNDIKKKIKSKNFNYIIIDNFPDLLSLSKKVILFSNFFWHRDLHSKDLKFKKIENYLVKKKIKIFGNYLFQKKYFSKFNNTKIPFFGNYKKNLNKKNILISVGTAKYSEVNNIKKIIIFYLEKGNFKNAKIFLDPALYDASFRKYNVIKANYSKSMYNKTKFAIIKPGLGTVEECLMRGIPILAYCKNTFPEFQYNAKIIKKFKLGYNFKTISKSINFILRNFNDKKLLFSHERRCANLKWCGEKIIEKYLKSQVNFYKY